MPHSAAMRRPTFFSLTQIFNVGLKFFNSQKWPRFLLCILDASTSVMALQMCRILFYLCNVFLVIKFHNIPHQSHTNYNVNIWVCLNNFFKIFRFIAKIFKSLQTKKTASQDRKFFLAAGCKFLCESNKRL